MNTKSKTRMLTEGAVCIALSIALSYLKIPTGLSFGGFGGSVDLVMVPLIIFSYRWGAPWGLTAGFAFGTLKYFVAEGFAISLGSFILDYSIAYAMVGLAGLLRAKSSRNLPLAALVGCVGRFIIHFISGVTIYKEYMPAEFLGLAMKSPAIYSGLYNGTYMLPNTVLAVVICIILMPLMDRVGKIK